jgi:Cupin-like domain
MRKSSEPLREYQHIDRTTFESEVVPANMPAILRGVVSGWPAADNALMSARQLASYLKSMDCGRNANVLFGSPDIRGRYFYNDAMNGFNFERREIPFAQIIDKLIEIADETRPMAVYAGAAATPNLVPGFATDNIMPLLDPDIAPRLWLGNASRIAAHYDIANNIACSVSGKRRFTLFPPEQIGNLYIGPLDFTMAGQPASMVDFSAPDYDRYPKFRDALVSALVADLEPGDAIYIPALWWHHVEAFGPFNLLVNYWWPPQGDGPAFESLALALLGIRDRSASERAAWRAYFDHYVFGEEAMNAAAHIPEHARTVLGPPSIGRAKMMIQFVIARLSQR